MKPELICLWMGIPFCRGLAAATWSWTNHRQQISSFPSRGFPDANPKLTDMLPSTLFYTQFRGPKLHIPQWPRDIWCFSSNIHLQHHEKRPAWIMAHHAALCISDEHGRLLAWRFMYIASYWLNSVAWEYRIIGNLMHVKLMFVANRFNIYF